MNHKPLSPSNPSGEIFHHNDEPTSPQDLSFAGLFRGIPVWTKIIGGAVLGPVWLVLGVGYGKMRGRMPDDFKLPTNPNVIAAILIACAIIGAAVGAALALRAVVQSHGNDRGQLVAFLKALFGMGKWSLLLFWVPMTIAATIIVVSVIGMPN